MKLAIVNLTRDHSLREGGGERAGELIPASDFSKPQKHHAPCQGLTKPIAFLGQ